MISIKVTVPTRKFASKKWLDSIASAQRSKSVKELRKLFNQTVSGWSEKPRMGWSQSKSLDAITLNVYATGPGADKWDLVNEGSPPHIIRPKKRFLMFRPGYRPATTPGVLQSRRKYRSGRFISSNIVRHPGFEGRKFTELIAESFATEFGIQMQEAVTKAAQK